MAETFIIRIWGSRGTFPQTSPDFSLYGGNTACVSLETDECFIVFDAGTGLQNFGQHWVKNGEGKPIHILSGHAHMDHLMGLYSFAPFHNKDAEIHLYGETKSGMTFHEQILNIMQRCYWPMDPDTMQANSIFHEVKPGEGFQIGDIRVETMRGFHPGDTVIYRVNAGERSMVYALDCELDPSAMEQIAVFAKNADIMVGDAHFDDAELLTHKGWGHSSWRLQSELRAMADAKLMLLMHYAITYDDAKLSAMEDECSGIDPDCIFAREGMEIGYDGED